MKVIKKNPVCYFCKIKYFLNGEIDKQSFSNPYSCSVSEYDFKYFQGLPFGLFEFENLQPD